MGRKKIGRNEKCPCGSGIKYKKCCLRKGKANPYARGRRGAVAPALDESSRVKPAGRGSAWSQGISFTPGAAQAVAMGERIPGVELHPWVVACLRDLTGIGPGGSAPRHTVSSVRSMETEAILAALADLGVEVDLARLEAEAEVYTSAWELAQSWGDVEPADQELLGLAGCELWRRTLPRRPSLEMLDGQMQAGYWALRYDRPREAAEHWLDLWDQLLEAFPEAGSIDELSEAFVTGLESVFNWSGDCEMELQNLAGEDRQIAGRARDLYERLASRLVDRRVRQQLSEFHYILGDWTRGEALLLSLIEEDPYDAGPYAVLSDHLGYAWRKEDYQDRARAVSLLERALGLPVRDAAGWDLEDRLRNHRAALAEEGQS